MLSKHPTEQDYKLLSTLENHAGFQRLMEWSEEMEREQSKLLLKIDAFSDPDQVTKLQASILEKQIYRNLLKEAVSVANRPKPIKIEIDDSKFKSWLRPRL